MNSRRTLVAFSLVCLSLRPDFAIAEAIDFAHEVVPILKTHCAECHGGGESKGGFSLNTRELMLDAGTIDVDSSDDSYLLDLVRSDDPETQMPPPDHERVPAESIATLSRWLNAGAPWEPGFTFGVAVYEPRMELVRPELPAAVDGREHPVDRLVDNYLLERGQPIGLGISDAEFVRRVSLDLVGLLPASDLLQEPTASVPVSRSQIVDRLLGNDVAYAEHWLTFFNDLLRNDYSGTGFITGGRRQISAWLYESLIANKPFDQMARELIAPNSAASRGYIDGIKWRGEVSAGQTLPIQFSQSVSQSFLGINMKCASCHDSFIDRWTLEDAYGLAAIYASEPLEIHRCDKPVGKTAEAAWLFPELGTVSKEAPRDARLTQLAALMTSRENGRFARTIVNRLWHRMLGRGLVHPVDAMQTEPWSEPLLDLLASELVDSGYDLKHVLRLIATSQTYQSQMVTRREATDAEFRGPIARRMTAEQFLDAVWTLSEAAPAKIEAPVFRGLGDAVVKDAGDVQAQWIWNAEPQKAPANQTLHFRKIVKLPAAVERAAAVITCDNSFQLFINGRLAADGNDWTDPQGIVLSDRLKAGSNRIDVLATNAGSTPNWAGLLFEARVHLADETRVTIASDDTWQWTSKLPSSREGRLGNARGKLNSATVIEKGPWDSRVMPAFNSRLAWAESGQFFPVRASLLKNTQLMRSLGRPTRDQIVSMRPDTLTTLEALDLANEPTLAKAFAGGGERWASREFESTGELVDVLFAEALSRSPTTSERDGLIEFLGETPTAEKLQDALWAVCMLPEFLLIR